MSRSDGDVPIVFVPIDSLEWGEQYSTAQDLADAFAAPVYEPWWPADAGPRRYRLRQPGPQRPYVSYGILADLPSRDVPLVVHGIAGPPDEVAGDHDWRPVPELTTHHGLTLTTLDGAVHLLVERPGIVVYVGGSRSLGEAVALAHTPARPRANQPTTMISGCVHKRPSMAAWHHTCGSSPAGRRSRCSATARPVELRRAIATQAARGALPMRTVTLARCPALRW